MPASLTVWYNKYARKRWKCRSICKGMSFGHNKQTGRLPVAYYFLPKVNYIKLNLTFTEFADIQTILSFFVF
jgi:hypothetical protein